MRKFAFEEDNAEIKQSLLQALAQLPQQDLFAISKELLFENDPKCQRLGRYYDGLLSDKKRAEHQIDSLFQDFREDKLIDRLYEVEVLSKTDDSEIRASVLDKLKRVCRSLHRPILQERVTCIIDRLEKELQRS